MGRTIIVGAGIASLQLGALLKQEGRDILLLEKLSRIGGRAFLWEKDGFSVDYGVHMVRFGPKSATAAVLRRLGHELKFADLGKSRVAFPDGRVVDFPTSPVGFLTTKMMTPIERLRALGLIIKMRRQDPTALYETSVADWMDQLGVSGGLRTYLTLVSGSMQVCPFLDRSSAGEMIENMKTVLARGKSVMYPRHGWKEIYTILTKALGPDAIRTGADVARVTVENGAATGVELVGGERIAADEVVVSLPVQNLFEILDPALVPADYVTMCQNLVPTAGVVLDYGLKRRISDDTGLWYLAEPLSFGIFTSNLCPEQAPAGKQLFTWFLPTNLADMVDETKGAALEQALERTLFRQWPGLQPAIEWRRAARVKMVDGVEVNVRQHRGRRPGCRVPGVGRMFLVGDSLNAAGAGGDIGHESVLECFKQMTGKEVS